MQKSHSKKKSKHQKKTVEKTGKLKGKKSFKKRTLKNLKREGKSVNSERHQGSVTSLSALEGKVTEGEKTARSKGVELGKRKKGIEGIQKDGRSHREATRVLVVKPRNDVLQSVPE